MSQSRETEIFTISLDPDIDNQTTITVLNEFTSSERSVRRRRAKNVSKAIVARLAVRHVAESMKQSSMLTTDYLLYTLFAGCITTAGLMFNDNISVAAAMCIEQVSNTVLTAAFGTIIHDWQLVKIGARNNCIVIVVCFVIGYIYGAFGIFWIDKWVDTFPTQAMVDRGEISNLWYGTLQACAGGSVIALCLFENNHVALVGLAILLNFMTPVTNAGLLMAFVSHISVSGLYQPYTFHNVSGHIVHLKRAWLPEHGYVPMYYIDMRKEAAFAALISIIYTYINIVCLYFMCVLTLKLKEKVPLGLAFGNKERQFFHEHLAAYRSQRLM